MKQWILIGLWWWLLGCCPAQARTWYVGILAPQGVATAQTQWQPWLGWLKRHAGGDDFVLVPLSLQSWHSELSGGKLDFALGPQVQFVTLPHTEGWRWLATLQPSPQARPRAMEQIGSAIWVRADSPVHALAQLRGARIVAVDAQAFGGYMLGQKRLLDAGLQQGRDYHVVFTGYPIEQALQALRQHRADAAIVPLCLMEEWQGQYGDVGQYRALVAQQFGNGCMGSTAIFPNWSLAALPQVPDAVASRVGRVLLTVPTQSGLPHWLPPASTAQTEQVLSALGRHPMQRSWQAQTWQWLETHRWLSAAVLLLVLVSLVNYAWMSWLAHRRRRKLVAAYAALRDRDRWLAHSDRVNIAGEMAAGLAHELNQPLSVIRHYADGGLYRLRHGGAADATQELLQTAFSQIIDATERSRSIIQRLRQWLQPADRESGTLDVAALFARCRTWLRWQTRSQPMVLHAVTDIDRFETVPGVVEQVLVNCLLNCVQQGARLAEVVVRQQGHAVHIVICDDGGGFSAERLAQPFVPFHSSKPQGLGLGLVICQRLLRQIGGDLRLANREDGVAGACVTLMVPRDECREEEP